MGRRALRKRKTETNLAGYLHALDELLAPGPKTLFGRHAPLEVEIGTGKGLFITRAAAEQPDTDFIGVEVAGKYARYAAGRLAQRGLRNAAIIHGDGLCLVRQWLSPGSVTAVHVYFPDPWWKKRHQKRRVMNLEFLQCVERILVPGGALHFWTDVEEYFRIGVETVLSGTLLEGPSEVPQAPAEHELDYRTHFERRTRLAGQPVYRALFRKRLS